MNSDDYNQVMASVPQEIRDRFAADFEAKETNVADLLRQGVDKITYFERRKENLRPQGK